MHDICKLCCKILNGFEYNEEWIEKIDSLIDFLATPEGQNWCVEFNGNCSAASTDVYNQLLSIDRADRVYKEVVSKVKAKGEAGKVRGEM